MQGVFQDEEVSEIQEETPDQNKIREIVGRVIKKGEKACYKFLRIIYMSRKRTLPPDKKSSAPPETEGFDLHHWISCFSFDEDMEIDVNYFQGILKLILN